VADDAASEANTAGNQDLPNTRMDHGLEALLKR
jgi:hypothetical protein